MEPQFIVRFILLIVMFTVSWWSLQALHFQKFLKANHVMQAQLLLIITAMCMAYLSTQFLMSLYRGF